MPAPRPHARASLAGGAALAILLTMALSAQKPAWYLSREGLALGGYDAVAYVTEARAVKGSRDHEVEWSGARWRFASASAREAFLEDPRRYAPQFGGYCAYAVSQGYTASGDPEAWSVVDGRLYVNYSKAVRRTWERQRREYIRKGEANWPAVLQK